MTAQKSERCKQRTVGDGEETVTGEQSRAEEEIKGGGRGRGETRRVMSGEG